MSQLHSECSFKRQSIYFICKIIDFLKNLHIFLNVKKFEINKSDVSDSVPYHICWKDVQI